MSSSLHQHAVVIPGEAPETDDEDELGSSAGSSFADARSAIVGKGYQKQPVAVKTPQSSEAIPSFRSHKYNSLLHKKLRENQVNLGIHAVEFSNRQCQAVEKELCQISSGIGNTQQVLQDASYKVRLMTDILYKVNGQLDTILSSQNLLRNLNSDFPSITQKSL